MRGKNAWCHVSGSSWGNCSIRMDLDVVKDIIRLSGRWLFHVQTCDDGEGRIRAAVSSVKVKSIAVLRFEGKQLMLESSLRCNELLVGLHNLIRDLHRAQAP